MSCSVCSNSSLSTQPMKIVSTDVVLSTRREHIDYSRIFERGYAMFHAAAYNKGVARSNVDSLSLAPDLEVPMHDIHDLLVRVAVHRAHPAFYHFMLGKKQFVVVRQHTAFQPVLRC